MFNGDYSFSRRWQGKFSWSCDGQNSIGGQFGLHSIWKAALWQSVAPQKLPRDESVIVLLLLVFPFDHHLAVDDFHFDVLRREMLDVHVYLELVFVCRNCRPHVLDGQVIHGRRELVEVERLEPVELPGSEVVPGFPQVHIVEVARH